MDEAPSAAPPRQLSVDNREHRRWPNLAVYLNGERQNYVMAYDIDAGTITKHATDDQGRLIREPDRRQIEREVLTGQVTVALQPNLNGEEARSDD